MLLIEILAPEIDRKIHMSVDADTSIGEVMDRICSVFGIDHDNKNLWELIYVDNLKSLSDMLTLREMGVINGGIMLFMKREYTYGTAK